MAGAYIDGKFYEAVTKEAMRRKMTLADFVRHALRAEVGGRRRNRP